MYRTTMLVFIVVVVGLATALMAYATHDGSGNSRRATIPQPTAAQLEAAYLGKLPVAPESKRVDVVAPSFSDPTAITNALFPISQLHSAVLNGKVDDKRFHTETTLLPERDAILCTRPLTADGRYTGEVETPVIGEGKRAAVRRALDERPDIDPADCYGYGDHVSDLPMLELVGHPVVVGGDSELREALARRSAIEVPR